MTEPHAPTVLFVCVKNGGKSQMAAALARKHAGDRLTIRSAGTEPGSALNAEAAASVEQVGASFRGEYPKPIDAGILADVDRLVVIGDAEIDSTLLAEAAEAEGAGTGLSVERWEVDEPSHRGVDGLERLALIRDELDERVRGLIDELLTAKG